MWSAIVLAALPQIAPAAPRDLVALAPADAWVVASFTDLGELRRTIAAHTWTRALIEPGGLAERFAEGEPGGPLALAALRRVFGFAGADDAALPDDAKGHVDRAVAAIDSIAGGVLWIGGEIAAGEPTFDLSVVFATGDPGGPLATALVADDDMPWVEHEHEGVLWRSERSDDALLLAFAEFDGVTAVVVAASERLDAQRDAIVARIRGGGADGVRASARHAEAMSSLRTTGQVELFVDLAPWIELALPMARGRSEVADRALERSGVAGIEWFAARFGVGAGEQLDAEWALRIPQRSGLAELLDLMRPAPKDLLAAVPAEAMLLAFGNYDLPGLYDVGVAIAESIHPGSASLVDSSLAMVETEVGISLRADVLDLIDGSFASFALPRAPDPNGAVGVTPHVGAVLGIADGPTLVDSLELLLEAAAEQDPSFDADAFVERERRETPDGEVLVLRTDVAGSPLEFGAIGPRRVAFALGDVDVVSLAAGTPEDGAWNSPAWSAALSRMERASTGSLARTGVILEWAADLVRAADPREDDYSDIDPRVIATVRALPPGYFAERFPGTMVRSLERIPLGLRGHVGAR